MNSATFYFLRDVKLLEFVNSVYLTRRITEFQIYVRITMRYFTRNNETENNVKIPGKNIHPSRKLLDLLYKNNEYFIFILNLQLSYR